MPPTCQLTVQFLTQCRVVLGRFHRMEQAEQWLVAGFLGVGLIMAWIALTAGKDRSFENASAEPVHFCDRASG